MDEKQHDVGLPGLSADFADCRGFRHVAYRLESGCVMVFGGAGPFRVPAEVESMNLFCYGTLRCAEVFRAVTGETRTGVEALLHGYAAYRFSGQDYPGLAPRVGATVSGVVYTRLSRALLARLDRYEGDEYVRQRVRVRLADGAQCAAWVYLCRKAQRARLSTETWDHQAFVRNRLGGYLRRLG